jgi:hypothetical protein
MLFTTWTVGVNYNPRPIVHTWIVDVNYNSCLLFMQWTLGRAVSGPAQI